MISSSPSSEKKNTHAARTLILRWFMNGDCDYWSLFIMSDKINLLKAHFSFGKLKLSPYIVDINLIYLAKAFSSNALQNSFGVLERANNSLP